jgi:hypothetical protein
MSTETESPWRGIVNKLLNAWCPYRGTGNPQYINAEACMEQAIALAVEACGQLSEEQLVKYPGSVPIITKPAIAKRMSTLLERQKGSK